MTDQEQSRSRSPFSELSYSQQQELWRAWRSKPHEYQDFTVPEPKVEPAPPAPQPYTPPSHKNLDRVHARLSAAVARTGAFNPLTSRE